MENTTLHMEQKLDRQAIALVLGIFIGYALVQAFKFLNSNLLWVLFYHH